MTSRSGITHRRFTTEEEKDRKGTMLTLPRNMLRTLKHTAIDKDTSLVALVERYIKEGLERDGLS